ncbi:MAG: DUF1345 domain-containing protein [Sphingobacteriaceae bacterium]|nr:MAG: DUF1345 domain-containing protein [Sphingobacteriaceae bacterium]
MARSERQVFFRLDAHYRLLIAAFASGVAAYFSAQHNETPVTILMSWIAFAVVVLIMDWIIILTSHPKEVRKIVSLEDSSRTLIFLFVIVAAVISLGAILLLLQSTKGQSTDGVAFPVILSLTSVVVSWWLVHTIFTLRYAHLYYGTDKAAGKPNQGLNFPGNDDPDYLDFVYFSFVIGMTFQVSDVEITLRPIRRLALFHSIISFVFNTAIVALSINVVAGLM